MVDIIFNNAAAIIIMFVGIYAYTALVSRVLPPLFLRPEKMPVKHERGLKKYVFGTGRAIAYEPRMNIRKYVSQYVLFTESGEKFIKCKTGEGVKHLECILTVYGRNDKVIGIYKIQAAANKDGYTDSVLIPRETSYVSLGIDKVNGKSPDVRESFVYSPVKTAMFCLCNVIASVGEGLLCTFTVKSIFDWIYFQSNGFAANADINYGLLVSVYAAMGIGISLIAFGSMMSDRKISWKKI